MVMKQFRINPDKERELFDFVKEKGPKPAVRFLFEFYQNNKNLTQNIIDELSKMDFKPATTTSTKKKTTQFNVADDFTNNF